MGRKYEILMTIVIVFSICDIMKFLSNIHVRAAKLISERNGKTHNWWFLRNKSSPVAVCELNASSEREARSFEKRETDIMR